MMRPMVALLLAACGDPPQEPRRETVEVPGSKLKFDLVRVPAGKARGADVGPFWIGACEVTWEEFLAYYDSREDAKVDGVTRPSLGLNHVREVPGFKQELATGKYPVTCIRWHGAAGYCAWLSKKTGHRYRLPTEAEWELAAALGRPKAADGWHGKKDPRKVGTGQADALGVHDLLGNMMEYGLEFEKPVEYAPVLKGGAWNGAEADLDPARRATVREEWYQTDPNRPRSTWWLSDAFFVGFRVVRVPDASEKDLEAYGPKVEVKLGAHEFLPPRARPGAGSPLARLAGEVKNAGDKTLDELEVTVFYLDPKGRPHLRDVSGEKPDRATFGACWPALGPSAHAGPHRAPLKPGETRAFEVEIPQSFDPDDEVAPDKFGAKVTALRIAK